MANTLETEHEVSLTVSDVRPNDFLSSKFEKHVTDVTLSWCDSPRLGLRGFNVWGDGIRLESGKSYRAKVRTGISKGGKEYKTISEVMPLASPSPSASPSSVPRPNVPVADERDLKIARMNAVKCLAMAGALIEGANWKERAEDIVDYTLNGIGKK